MHLEELGVLVHHDLEVLEGLLVLVLLDQLLRVC